MDQRLIFDVLSAVLLLATALIGAWLPRYLNQRADGNPNSDSRASMAFHLGNMLSGGVMLSAGFCHLLADSLREVAFVGRFPIATFLAALGYIITLLADQIVTYVAETSASSRAHAAGAAQWGAYAPPGEHARVTIASPPPEEEGEEDARGVAPLIKQGFITGDGAHMRDAHSGHGSNGAPSAFSVEGGAKSPSPHPQGAAANGGGYVSPRTRHGRANSSDASSLGDGHEPGNGCAPWQPHHHCVDAAGGSGADGLAAAGAHNHAAQLQVFLGQKKLSFATAVLLALALCIHSMLEGIALGAQESMRSTEDIMIAIAAHKGLAAYALGASIVESKASTSKFWTVIGLFACATPLGIAIGYGFSEMGSGKLAACMSALASGTFLYVAMMEVIPKELEDPRHRLPKMGMLLLGFGLMSLLAVWA